MKNFSTNDIFNFRQRVFIIAEISANHGQSFSRAVKMIKTAKACGADAVKFQAYTPDSITIDCDNKYFQIKHHKWGGQSLYELYSKAYTPLNWFKKLKHVADSEGILFFATAFDFRAVDLLESINVPLHKIASFELVDLPLIEYAAKTKKPMIISTGMATILEIREAVTTAKKSGVKEIALLKCVSTYPANPEDMHLNTIRDMKKKFGCRVGLSDHSLGVVASVMAVAYGAQFIEKHITLSRGLKTADSFFSIEPRELKLLVESVHFAEKLTGDIFYGPTKQEKNSLRFRRSLFVIKDIKKGELFTVDNVRSIRPGAGIAPKYLTKVIGARATCSIQRGTPLRFNHFG